MVDPFQLMFFCLKNVQLRLKPKKDAKFERDLLKTNEDIASQSQ